MSPPELWIYEDDERVLERLGCPNPNCNERRMDHLRVVDWDDDTIHCETCGVWYKLPWPRQE